jgi:thioredoxin
MGLSVITEEQFEAEVLRSELPVLVDFFAEWCQPCKQMTPILETLARELEGKAKLVKVDIDQSQRLAGMLRIQSVPTYMVFHQGRPVAAERGVLPKAKLQEVLEPFLPRAQGAIKVAELAELLKQNALVPIDIRDENSYRRAHIPKAVNLPLETIETRLAEMHMHGTPILYCRSGDKSKELAEKLAGDQIPVAFLEGGFLAWEIDMHPIERS